MPKNTKNKAFIYLLLLCLLYVGGQQRVWGQDIDTLPKHIPSAINNSNNNYDPALIPLGTGLLNTSIREIVSATAGFNNTIAVSEGTDYGKLENARKLQPNEFTYHPQLGYISLQQRLMNDEVLAGVA